MTATGGHLDGRALLLSILCPLLIAAPVSSVQFWQNQRLHEARAMAETANAQLETLHSALVDAHAALAERARRDALTGLFNREGFFSEVEATSGGALLMIDVDHFKKINDTYGHLDGDNALREIASQITLTAQPDAIVGRIGGEEFTVCLPGGDLETAVRTGERIRKAIVGHEIVARDNRIIPLSVSIGGAVHHPDKDVFAALSLADDCLYQAKNSGRNRVVIEGHHRAAA